MVRELNIDGRIVNDDSDCFVIAEIGHNHQGDLKKALDMVKAAKECGADAVKFQKRDNVSLYTQAMFDSPYVSENAYGPTYGTHREALEFGNSEYMELQAYAVELGITLFATAFDFKSADFLEDLGMPLYKMASADLTNIPLLKYVAQAGKPMIISTGGATTEDVLRAMDVITSINEKVAILQCTASYPAEPEEMDLRVVQTFRDLFPEHVIGLSDHQNGIAMGLAAYVLGARIIEKHFTLNRAWKGTDQAFSLEPGGLRRLVRDLQRAHAAFGDGVKKQYPSEAPGLLKMRKKLVAAADLSIGHILSIDDVALKSPGDGLAPSQLGDIVGRSLTQGLKADEDITLAVLSG
jgi:sialic acid synthase